MAREKWIPAIIHCPNCGTIVTGYRDDKGCAKIHCETCQANMVTKQVSRRHERIDLFAPQGQVSIN